MMADPFGNMRLCHTPLAVYIADSPEAAMLACVAGKTSYMTTASYKQFGDSFRHETRIGSTTLAQIDSLVNSVDPWDLQAYYKLALESFRLSTVHLPFWRDWPLSDPSHFFGLEPLHHLHKAFYDHDVKWCIKCLGDEEINFRFSVLQPRQGFRHFSQGIAGIKQATGREHRDIQRYLVAVIADAANPDFVIAIRALMDFRYLAQRESLTEADLLKLTASLKEFHDHKHAILDARVRLGSKKKPINNFQIPKLEMLHSVATSTRLQGVSIQWSADVTEHCNITLIKEPARAGNNKDYDVQICRYLDRGEKARMFNLATSLRETTVDFDEPQGSVRDESNDSDDSDSPTKLSRFFVPTAQVLQSHVTTSTNYFIEAQNLLINPPPWTLHPLRTFSTLSTAFHLLHRASKTKISVDEAALRFDLPDLRPALADYVQRVKAGSHFSHSIGGRRIAVPGVQLPFSALQIWYSVRMQTHASRDPSEVSPTRTIYASPTCSDWPRGRYDTVLVSNDPDVQWPGCGLSGKYHISFYPCKPIKLLDSKVIQLHKFDLSCIHIGYRVPTLLAIQTFPTSHTASVLISFLKLNLLVNPRRRLLTPSWVCTLCDVLSELMVAALAILYPSLS
jgi:hypothetical protein